MQLSLQELSSAGILAIMVLEAPGAHGATVTGMHGIGVNTPKAAAVAAATIGLERELHMANGKIFTMGLLSIMLASGILLVITRFNGSTINELGAVPNVHDIIAPIHTCCGIVKLFCSTCYILCEWL